jgi:hypothetical protein
MSFLDSPEADPDGAPWRPLGPGCLGIEFREAQDAVLVDAHANGEGVPSMGERIARSVARFARHQSSARSSTPQLVRQMLVVEAIVQVIGLDAVGDAVLFES